MSSDKKELFILEKLPEYYNKGYSTIKIGMSQFFTEEWLLKWQQIPVI
jgi:exopolysaccharide biosynthesis predicted pyruvyltransferase EpsI